MNQSRMQIHCGGVNVPIEQLKDYELPEATRSYHPIPHFELAEFVKSTAEQLQLGTVVRESYAVAKDGARMFGLQTFGKEIPCEVCEGTGFIDAEYCYQCQGKGWYLPGEMGLSVAFRNSYDKSMSVGIAMGFNVFICDNLCIAGEIKIVRKHTRNCWEDIDQVLVHTMLRKRPEIETRFYDDVKIFKGTLIPLDTGYEIMGRMVGHRALSVTQFSVALNEWNCKNRAADPAGPGIPSATAWDLYNCCTYALKSTPPQRVLEAHQQVHEMVLRSF